VEPGKEAELLEGIRAVKQHLDRLGESLSVVRQLFGPEAGNIVASWSVFGMGPFSESAVRPRICKIAAGYAQRYEPSVGGSYRVSQRRSRTLGFWLGIPG
jgi:hypothetical protein